ncbi:MAG: hypothetical protein RLY61_828 [Candidatus Parcubacteria bacterium]
MSGNNIFAAYLPNLVVTQVEPLVPANTVRVTITNTGTSNFSKSVFPYRLKIWQDSTIKSIAVNQRIAPTQSISVDVPFTLMRKPINVHVDSTNKIKESNEVDNKYTYEFPALPEFTGRVFTDKADDGQTTDWEDPHNYSFYNMEITIFYTSPVPLTVQAQLPLDNSAWSVLGEIPEVVEYDKSMNTNYDGVTDKNIFIENFVVPASKAGPMEINKIITFRIRSTEGSAPITYPMFGEFAYEKSKFDEKLLSVSEMDTFYPRVKTKPINVSLYNLTTGANSGTAEIWYKEDVTTGLSHWAVSEAYFANLPSSDKFYIHLAGENLALESLRTLDMLSNSGSSTYHLSKNRLYYYWSTYPTSGAPFYTKLALSWYLNNEPAPNVTIFAAGDIDYN